MELTDVKTVRSLLEKEGFSFKKSLGQNFLIDDSVCPKMAQSVCDGKNGIIEIGPGAGVLTKELCQRAKKVVAIELDKRLEKVLEKTVGEFDNLKIIFGDALKLDLFKIINDEFCDCENVCVCANLPYYITSPMVMSLLESRLPIDSITVMVQKEAADRLCAKVGSREAGAVTVAVSYYCEAEKLFDVNRDCFIPSPNVDSSVIKLKVRKEPPVLVNDEKKFFAFVKACFAQRRKTLVNSVSNVLGMDKERVISVLSELGIDISVRSETLTLFQLATISNLINEK